MRHSNGAFNCGSNGEILISIRQTRSKIFSKVLQRPVPSGTRKINKEIRKYAVRNWLQFEGDEKVRIIMNVLKVLMMLGQ